MNEDGKEKNSGQNKIPLFSDPTRIELKKEVSPTKALAYFYISGP